MKETVEGGCRGNSKVRNLPGQSQAGDESTDSYHHGREVGKGGGLLVNCSKAVNRILKVLES